MVKNNDPIESVALDKLIKWTKYIPEMPFANQILFLMSDELEVLYGGAARGGKSFAMLMAALQYVDEPGYHALILRKNFSELNLAGALIPVSKQWLMNTDAHWSETKTTWSFPSGATLTFGYLEAANDVYRYLGSEYQFIGFDELTEQPEDNYRFLFTRLVRTKELASRGIPLRMRATTNPGGEYAEWVHERFIAKETRRKYFTKAIDDIIAESDPLNPRTKESITPEEIRYRVPRFIPSKVFDNPYIDHARYVASLSNVDVVRRAQYLEGDWSIRVQGNMFRRDYFEIVNPARVPLPRLTYLRYWDFAATTDETSDYTATCKMGYDKRDRFTYIVDMEVFKAPPAEVEKRFRVLQKLDGSHCVTCIEQEPGSAGVNNIDYYKRKVSIPGFIFYGDKATGDKESRARPLAAAAGNGLIKIVDFPKRKGWYGDVMAQAEAFPEGSHDDAVDAMAGCYNYLMKHVRMAGQYITKLDTPMTKNNEDFAPAYMKKEQGRNILEMLIGGNPEAIFKPTPTTPSVNEKESNNK